MKALLGRLGDFPASLWSTLRSPAGSLGSLDREP